MILDQLFKIERLYETYPNIKSAVSHSIFAKLMLWDRLTIRPMIKYTPNRSSEIYTLNNDDYYSTFANANLKQYIIQVLYDQPLGAHFKLGNMLAYLLR